MRALVQVFFGLLVASPVLAAESESAFGNLRFDEPSQMEAVVPPAKGLGPTGSVRQGFAGLGLTLEIPKSEKVLWWSQLAFGTGEPLFTTQFDDDRTGLQTQYFDMKVKDRFAISTGLDRQVPLGRRHKWVLVGGLGASLSRSHVEMTSYPKLCGFWCGFDSSKPSYDSKIDWAVLGYLRMGIKLNDVWGGGFNWALMIITKPWRYPKFVELDTIENGRKQVNPDPDGYFQIETTYRF